MTQPLYKLWQGRFTEAWYQLSQDEQQQLLAQVAQALPDVGGRTLTMCSAVWANEEWPFFGLEQFPDLDAVQQHARILTELNWSRYIMSRSTLGTELASEP